MEASRFEAPTEIEGAVALLAAEEGARVLAGGTDLLVQMRLRRGVPDSPPPPSVFVDVKRIPRMMRTQLDATGLTLGAAVPAAEIFENQTIKKRWPGLAEATDLIGSTQVQGRATWCGNLCNASPAADSVPAMIACGTTLVIAGPSGEREVPVEGFAKAPGKTILERGELVVEFKVPAPAPHSADAYLRLIPRTEMDIAVVGAAVQLELDEDGTVLKANVILGAVAPTAIRVPAAEAALVGSRLEEDAVRVAAEAASAAANPIDDKRGTIAYRKKIAGVLTRRAAHSAYERARAR